MKYFKLKYLVFIGLVFLIHCSTNQSDDLKIYPNLNYSSNQQKKLDEKYKITGDPTKYSKEKYAEFLIENFMNKGELEMGKKWDELEAFLIKARLDYSKVPEAHEEVILFYIARRDFDQARISLKKAKDQFPLRGDFNFLEESISKLEKVDENDFKENYKKMIQDWNLIKELHLIRASSG
jgi:hypothetical protein